MSALISSEKYYIQTALRELLPIQARGGLCSLLTLETLCKVHEVSPFKLVFLLEVSDPLQWEAQWKVEGPLGLVITKVLLNFPDSPPICGTRFGRARWERFIL